MRLASLHENRAEPLDQLFGHPLGAAELKRLSALVRSTGLRLQASLGTSSPPLAMVDAEGMPGIRATGIAGTFRFAETEWTVIPKFVSADAVAGWQRSVLTMVRRATPRSFQTERRGRLGTTPLQLVDLFALAFAEAVEDAARGDPVHAYKSQELELPIVRGRLRVSAQLQHLLSRPTVFSCEVDQLNTHNPVNLLLHWAAARFSQLARSGAVRQALRDAADRLPPLSGQATLPTNLPVYLAPQYGNWREAVDLASLLATGRGQGETGRAEGYGFVLNMARAFESFVDASLRDGLARQTDAQWMRVPQASRIFATPLTQNTRPYWSRPDDLIQRDGESVALVDAKYKLLADAEDGTPKRPSNADIYQMACSLVSHGVSRGLLVYPQVTTALGDNGFGQIGSDGKFWRIEIAGRSLVIGAVAVDLQELATQSAVARFDVQLVEHVRAILAIAA